MSSHDEESARSENLPVQAEDAPSVDVNSANDCSPAVGDSPRTIAFSPEALRGKLSDEDMEQLKRTTRRRLIFAAIAGVLVLILGFFAGKNLAEQRNSMPEFGNHPYVLVLESDGDEASGFVVEYKGA
ncbi:hypothetical protein I6E29_03620 [Arcanobacterium haemolyticum]|nr:hypothetical protein [Arcanobacterium haemolyticum]